MKLAEMAEMERRQLGKHGIHHVVLLPIQGKKSTIGMLALACADRRRHSGKNWSFWKRGAEAGMRGESAAAGAVTRSQQQWANTFDSILDVILAHDAEFRIVRRIKRCCSAWKSRPAMYWPVVPGDLAADKSVRGCPYCERGLGLTETSDPCFGGQSAVSSSLYTEPGGRRPPSM